MIVGVAIVVWLVLVSLAFVLCVVAGRADRQDESTSRHTRPEDRDRPPASAPDERPAGDAMLSA